MKKKIIILGSTGSIGSATLSVIKDKNFKVELLTANKNINKLLKQSLDHNVKKVIIENKKEFKKKKHLFTKKKIKVYLGLKSIKKILRNKVAYCINSISGIEGLGPTIDVIPFTKNILMANKESIICGWDIIKKKLKKENTNFIPIDSEHYSIKKLIDNDNNINIDKIVLTASGGPFLNLSKKKIVNAKPEMALNHPNWKMGKKISIDSATMMNKIFEYIEAKKIFNLEKKQLSILIHPTSFVHAIVFYNSGLIKFLGHETKMTIPISNALNIDSKYKYNTIKKHLPNLNNLKFIKTDHKLFPVLEIIDMIPDNDSFFETILITINDSLVEKYLKGQINYLSIQKNLLKLIKSKYFRKFYKLKPKSIYDIKNMIYLCQIYLENNIKHYDR